MKSKMILTAVALATSGLVFVPTTASAQSGAQPERRAGEPVENTADRASDAAENAANKTGNVVIDNPNRTEGPMNNVGNEVDGQPGGVRVNTGTDAAMTNPAASGSTVAAPDAEDIRDTLASATEAFVAKGTFDDLVERFVDADRNRIGTDRFVEQEHEDLNDAVDRFQAAWKDKYNKAFDIADETMVYNDQQFRIMQSEIGQGAQPAAGKVTADATVDDGKATVNVDNNTGVDRPDSKAADTNRNDAGRNIATVTVNNAMGNVQVPLIHEAPDSWKIDVPDGVDGPKLKSNVIAHLNAAVAMKDQWPADANEAYRAISTHMLKAVLDQPASMK